jgi:hypothetical protein
MTAYSWKMALNTGINASYNNMPDWRGIWERQGRGN